MIHPDSLCQRCSRKSASCERHPMKKAFSVTVLVGMSTVLFTSTAWAKPQGLQGSYVGVNQDTHQVIDNFLKSPTPQTNLEDLLKLPQLNEPQGQTFQGRLDIQNSPVSIRGAAFLSPGAAAIEPTISYDLPVMNQTNLYVGAGYTFVENHGESTPLGDKNAAVFSAGVEAAVNRNLVIYGNARLRLNQDIWNESSPVKLQWGAGYRF